VSTAARVPTTPTPDDYELPPSVTEALAALARAVLDVEPPLERIAAIRLVEQRVAVAIGASALALAMREAREDRWTWEAIGAAYGVTGQRAAQIARTDEAN
jgi:hypothetical protein